MPNKASLAAGDVGIDQRGRRVEAGVARRRDRFAGPLLVFAGVTRGRTEVLPTAVYLELSVQNVEAAVAIAASAVLAIMRRLAGQTAP